MMRLLCLQRAGFALCLILVMGGCSRSSVGRQWEIQEIKTEKPRFNGGRILLGPDSDYSHLELELIRNASGMRLYINLLFLEAQPLKENLHCTSMTIQFEEQEPWIVHPYLLEGGQRLLLPGYIADSLIQALLEERSFVLRIGRSYIHVIPNQFLKNYARLLEIPIEETVAPSSPFSQNPLE